MRTLKIFQHVSLDGVMQHTPDGTDFPYAGWQAAYRTPEGMAAVLAAHGERFDLVLGRVTYDRWVEFWPGAAGPMAERINAATKFVVTHRAQGLDWGPVEHLAEGVVEGVQRVKASDGPDLVVTGSSSLVSLLLEHGLADQLLVASYPVLLGRGKRFFAEGTPRQALQLAGTQTTPSGVILSDFRPVPV